MLRPVQRRGETATTATRLIVPLVATLAALGVGAWDLGRPALWLDETATTVASERTWPNLWLMLHGSDAPLVPYYAVIKGFRALTDHLVAPGHLEILLRWPSVAAIALAVGLLTRWLQRVASTAVAVTAAALLLLTVGVSRYAQEARPYALVLCLAVCATITWWRAVVEGRRAAVPLYVLSIAGLVFLHVMALLLVPVHVVAAAVLGPARTRRILTTVLASAAGAALVSPFTVLAMLHGQGATRYAGLSAGDLATALASLFSSGTEGLVFVVPTLVLAVLGALDRNSPLVRLALVWALLPPAIFAAAVAVRPNLMIPRYLLFTLPAWAILAALGLVRLGTLAARVTSRPWRPVATATLVTAVIVVLGVLQWPALTAIRAPGGHGEDLRPSLVAAGTPAHRDLGIYVGPAHDGVEIQAYSPLDARRVVNSRPQSDQAPVWPQALTIAQYRAALHQPRELIVLLRHGNGLPNSLLRRGFRIASQLPHGRGWVTYLAVRRP